MPKVNSDIEVPEIRFDATIARLQRIADLSLQARFITAPAILKRPMLMKSQRILLSLLAIACCSVSPNAGAQVIWITPRQGPDFLPMFEKDAPWQSVSAHVSVVTFPIELVLRRPDDDLREAFADLKRRGIKLGVQFMALSGRPNPDTPDCGVAVEGYSAKGEPLQVARKVKRLGGQIDFLGMDEPLFFGHQFDRYEDPNSNPKRRGCHLSIQEVAADAAERIQMVRSEFPDVKVGEAEPLMGFTGPTWLEDLSSWFDAFQSASGQRLAFFRLDLHWRQPWQARMPQLVDLLQKKGIPLGIIYDGSTPNDDAAWVREAAQRFKDFEAGAHLKPQSVHFLSWTPSPSRTLPESDPKTMTGLVNTYIAWKQQRGEPVKRLQ